MAKFTDVIAGLSETTDPQGDSDYIVGYDGSAVVKYLINNLPFAASTLALDELGAPSDSTSLNASTDAHGLLPKLDGTSTNFLDGTGAWSVPAGGGGGATSSDIVLTGTDSDLPAAETEGRLYLPSDGASIYRDTGAAWERWGGMWKFTEPAAPTTDTFTWINQTGITVTKSKGILHFTNSTTDTKLGIMYKDAPSTPYTIDAVITSSIGNNANSEVGICFVESASGKIHGLTIGIADGGSIYSRKWTDYQTFSAAYATQTYRVYTYIPFMFLRIVDDATNRLTYWSMDGVNYKLVNTIGRTDFLTADKVGFFIRKAESDLLMSCLSWRES